jgi:uncharacterized protein (DUF433 family)
MAVSIICEGGAPRIEGTRINVYDIVAELGWGTPPAEIAKLYLLTDEQLEAALQYLKEHAEEVLQGFQKVKEREARGNPPELQARLDAIRAECAPR